MNDLDELNQLTRICNQHGNTLGVLVKRLEAAPESVDTSEVQAEIRREIAYASLIADELNTKLKQIMRGLE